MQSNNQKIIYPFVYLDSSNILRISNSNLESLTEQFARKHPQKYRDLLLKIEASSEYDNDYYLRIKDLLQREKISALITFETANRMFIEHDSKIITLLGKMQTSEISTLILWGENVDFKLYTQAAMSIVNASCVVADVDFLKISVGRSLTKYVTAECAFYILSKDTNIPFLDVDYTVLKLAPKEFIQDLVFDIN